jgi:hypothetical protein
MLVIVRIIRNTQLHHVGRIKEFFMINQAVHIHVVTTVPYTLSFSILAGLSVIRHAVA